MYANLYKWDFKRVLNFVIVSALRTSSGKEFHNRGAAILNARKAHASFVLGTERNDDCLKIRAILLE